MQVNCLLFILVSQIPFTITGQGLWIELVEETPGPKTVLCPYEPLEMSCRHSTTPNEPDWRVTNNTVEILRSIDFSRGQLPNHRIVNNSDDAEVLLIEEVLPAFDGLQYHCLYDLLTGPRLSNALTINMEDISQVSSFQVEKVSDSSVQLSWEQTDLCGQTSSFMITFEGNGTKMTTSKTATSSRQMQFFSAHLTLSTDVDYTVSIAAVANDGRMSEFTIIEYKGGEKQALRTTHPTTTLCNQEPHTCILYAITGALVLIICVLGVVLVVYTIRRIKITRHADVHQKAQSKV